MSRKLSKRQRTLDVIIDHIHKPAFIVRERGPWFIVEPNFELESPIDTGPAMTNEMHTYEPFDDKKTALFCRDFKNAEAMLAAIEAIK